MKNFKSLICILASFPASVLMSGQTILVDNLSAPYDVVADQDSNIYISDSSNRRIIKANSDGTNASVIVNFSANVYGLSVKNNKLFALEGGDLVKMNLDGSNPVTIATIGLSYYLTSDDSGYIYFASNGSIQRIKDDGTELSVVKSGFSPSTVVGIVFDSKSNLLYYANGNQVHSMKSDGTGDVLLTNQFSELHNLRLDSSGNLYIADARQNVVKILSADRKKLTTVPNTSLNAPTSTFVTKNGSILVSDTWGGKIRLIDAPAATALNFDGINDYVSGTNTLLPQDAQERTVEAMIKVPSQRNSPYASSSIFNYGSFSNSKRFCLMLSNGNLAFIGENNDIFTNVNLRDDKWHHVAVTYKNNTIKLYVDGEIVKVATVNNIKTEGSNFLIGASYRYGIDEVFEGNIDEVRVWGRALTQKELKSNMNCELKNPTQQNALLNYYQFNQGKNESENTLINTLTDASSSSNTAQLNNFALSGPTSNWLLSSPIVTGNSCPSYIPSLDCTNVTPPNSGVYASENPNITWSTVNDADGYKIYLGTSSGQYEVVNGTSTTNTTYTFTGLSNDTTYFLKVLPYNSEVTAGGCQEYSFKTGAVLAINDVNNTVSISPNPFINNISLSNYDLVSQITIHDLSGKLVKTMGASKEINLSNLSSGVYYINLKFKNGTVQNSKIIKK